MHFKKWLEIEENLYPECFYFGTFDPVHNDHIRCARAAERLISESIIFVPAGKSPFKIGQETAPLEDRIKMCKLAGFNATDIESQLPKPSYTINTLRALIPTFDTSDVKVPVIMGEDNLLDFHKWEQAEELAKKLVILLCERGESRISSNMELDIRPLGVSGQGVSSTEIRDKIKNKQPINNLVPPPVAKYIQENQLYT
jgi:nicotinate-nucleotide adenylyltransferase